MLEGAGEAVRAPTSSVTPHAGLCVDMFWAPKRHSSGLSGLWPCVSARGRPAGPGRPPGSEAVAQPLQPYLHRPRNSPGKLPEVSPGRADAGAQSSWGPPGLRARRPSLHLGVTPPTLLPPTPPASAPTAASAPPCLSGADAFLCQLLRPPRTCELPGLCFFIENKNTLQEV